MKSHKNMKWVYHKNQLSLVTTHSEINFDSSYKKNNLYFYTWNPFTSKFAASIFNGLEILPIFENTKLLYLTNLPNETLIHLSNFITSDGIIFLNHLHSSKLNKKNPYLSLNNIKLLNSNKDYLIDVSELLDIIIIDVDFDFENEFNQICENYEQVLLNQFQQKIVYTFDSDNNPFLEIIKKVKWIDTYKNNKLWNNFKNIYPHLDDKEDEKDIILKYLENKFKEYEKNNSIEEMAKTFELIGDISNLS